MKRERALNVFLTVDTEIWCGGWQDLDKAFPQSFRKYIYGETSQGDFGLPYLLDVLAEHGLKAVFYVEPLFALRFGLAPLTEIVELIQTRGQAVDLHLHTEWVDEAIDPLIDCSGGKRQHIKQFSFEEQCLLIEKGIALLKAAGANNISSYRAGNFGANNETLRALATTEIKIDSSYNPASDVCDIKTHGIMHQAGHIEGVLEVPMNVFRDGLGKVRPTTITACSFAEMKTALTNALHNDWDNLVFLTHSFEMLNDARSGPNSIVKRRFIKLCQYLDAHSDLFRTSTFETDEYSSYQKTAQPLICGPLATTTRLGEQLVSRFQ